MFYLLYRQQARHFSCHYSPWSLEGNRDKHLTAASVHSVDIRIFQRIRCAVTAAASTISIVHTLLVILIRSLQPPNYLASYSNVSVQCYCAKCDFCVGFACSPCTCVGFLWHSGTDLGCQSEDTSHESSR